MGNDWQDYRPKDRRLDRDARQSQTPQSSQQWDTPPRQDWRPEMTGGPSPARGLENRQPPQPSGPRQTGSPVPHNGSGLLSRARNGGMSGPLGPQERASGPLGPRTSGPLGPQPGRSTRDLGPDSSGAPRPSGRGFTPPGQSAAPRPSGRLTSGRQSDLLNEPTRAGANGSGRRISGPTERGRNGGGGLLSFARAASSAMRAIITGKHRASQANRSEQSIMGAPPLPGAEEERPRPHRYRRSRTRLVIQKRWQRRTSQGKRMLIAGIVSGFLVALVVGVSIFGANSVYAFYQDSQNMLGALANPAGFSQTTRFYDRNGTLLWEMPDVNSQYRIYLTYAQIPQVLINATIDTEDKTFWTNSGVNVTSIVRAALANISQQQITQGASTITQQLIKQAFFVDPNTGVASETYTRKIQEALMAYAVTGRYSKEQILEFYLNIIFYGYLSRGVEAAAENMFGLMPKQDPKTRQMLMGAQQLDLAQAALLAGLPQGPTLYNPCGGDSDMAARRAAALQRMHDVVLTSMLSVNDITQQQFNQADAEAHTANFFNCQPLGVKNAPHFVDYVKSQLDSMLDPADSQQGDLLLAHAGWNIYTTIDLKLENFVESTVQKYLYQNHTDHWDYDNGPKGPLSQTNNIHDAAVVVMDPRDGDILAMDGSADYNNPDIRVGGEYNAAAQGYIQPGSSFKPVEYAAAFEMGWFPSLVMKNVRTCYPVDSPSSYRPAYQTCGRWYAPINYNDNLKLGSSNVPKPGIRLRDALGNSLNIPAVDTLEFVGLDNVINMAERMGLSGDPKDNGKYDTFSEANRGPSIALGSAGVRLLDMVDAYSIFPNGGYRVPPRSILLITDAQGNVVPGGDFHDVTKTQVISPQTAFLITSILADNNARVAEFGANNALTFGNGSVLYAAAKTGTTDDFKDNVTMGYTPYLTVGVWAGNANGEVMTPNTLGITGAAPIWHEVILQATKEFGYPNSYWPVPPGVARYSVNPATGLAPYQGTSGTYPDWFNTAMLPDIS